MADGILMLEVLVAVLVGIYISGFVLTGMILLSGWTVSADPLLWLGLMIGWPGLWAILLWRANRGQ